MEPGSHGIQHALRLTVARSEDVQVNADVEHPVRDLMHHKFEVQNN